MGDVVNELLFLLLGRQFAVEKEIGDFKEIALGGKLLDRVSAIEEDTFVAVDIGDARTTGGGSHEPGIVGEMTGLRVELADVDHVWPDRPAHHRKLDRLSGCV